MRRRLQESFHISPSAAALSTNNGILGFGGGGGGIPSISVSVQTDPVHLASNGQMANGHLQSNGGQTILANGHLGNSALQGEGGASQT